MFVHFVHYSVVLLSQLYCLAVLVIFGVVVSFKRYCSVLLTVLFEILIVSDLLKIIDDLHIIQTLKYEMHNTVLQASQVKLKLRCDLLNSLLFSDLSFGPVPIKR